MEPSPAVRHLATAVAVAGLGGAAAVHAAWATGSTWPAADSDELADLVVGRRPMPGQAACLAVVGLLGGAVGVLVVDRTDVAGGRALGRLAHRATGVAAVTLSLRAAVGFVVGCRIRTSHRPVPAVGPAVVLAAVPRPRRIARPRSATAWTLIGGGDSDRGARVPLDHGRDREDRRRVA